MTDEIYSFLDNEPLSDEYIVEDPPEYTQEEIDSLMASIEEDQISEEVLAEYLNLPVE